VEPERRSCWLRHEPSAKSTAGSENSSHDAVLEEGHVEIEEQADAKPGPPQIGQAAHGARDEHRSPHG